MSRQCSSEKVERNRWCAVCRCGSESYVGVPVKIYERNYVRETQSSR